MCDLELSIRAATETAIGHGVTPDRCEILQDGSTLVVRLSETLVARVVTDRDGPRQGSGWFARETAVAQYLASRAAPVIPMHPDLPPGPHEHLGFTLNFWEFVTAVAEPAEPAMVGATLYRCHEILRGFPQPLPELGILTETLSLVGDLERRGLVSASTARLLRDHLVVSLEVLGSFPSQPLHGDAHAGNLMNTTRGVLWTDWEDTFVGPVEWDLASIIWNARILDEEHRTADEILAAYCQAGGRVDPAALQQCLIARAAVMSAWYPVLYPHPDADRQRKLQMRLEWLQHQDSAKGDRLRLNQRR